MLLVRGRHLMLVQIISIIGSLGMLAAYAANQLR
jgi:hypothetical protein